MALGPSYNAVAAIPLTTSTASHSAAAAALASSLASKASSGSGFSPSQRQQQQHDNDAQESLTKTPQRYLWWNIGTTCAAIACIVSAAVAMYVEQTVMVYVAFCFPIFTGSLLLLQKIRLGGISPLWMLRNTMNQVQGDVQRLHNVQHVFSKEISRLEAEQEDLQDVEQQLEDTVKQRGGDMREMKRLVREHGRIQRQMKRLTAAEELQQLMSVMLNSDRNKDFVFTEKEIDQLFIRLRAFNVVDRDRLRTVFQMASTKSFHRLYKSAVQEFAAAPPPPKTTFLGDCQGDEALGSAFDYMPWE